MNWKTSKAKQTNKQTHLGSKVDVVEHISSTSTQMMDYMAKPVSV